MFYLEKLVGFLIDPITIFVIVNVCLVLIVFFSRVKWVRVVLVLHSTLPMVFLTFPLSKPLLASLETYAMDTFKVTSEVSAIVIMGGGQESVQTIASGKGQFNSSGERFLEAFRIYNLKERPLLIFSGGVASRFHDLNASDATELVMRDFGIPQNQLYLEKNAKNTLDNALFVDDYIKELGVSPKTTVVVTSAFHARRTKFAFCLVSPQKYLFAFTDFRAAETPNYRNDLFVDKLKDLQILVHEKIGYLYYKYKSSKHTRFEECAH